MADKNTNTFAREFLSNSEPYYAPLQPGEYKVTLGKPEKVFDVDEDGNDKSHLLIPLHFDNGRRIDARYYSYDVAYACSDLRKQLNDQTVYPSIDGFLNTLEGKEVTVYIVKEYYTKNDVQKSALKFKFMPPEVIVKSEAVDDEF